MIKINTKILASKKGSTIIELLISLMIVGLITIAVAVAATQSIKNTGEARFKQAATVLAQEVIEKSRGEKNRMGFPNFRDAVGSNTYCFDSMPSDFDSLPGIGSCSGSEDIERAGGSFFRNVRFSYDPSSETVQITVAVSWNDSGNTRTVELVHELVKPSQGY